MLLGCMLLHGSLTSSCLLFWTQSRMRGALRSTFQWCFYTMLDKWFACAFWKLTCKAVTQSAALSGIVCFPELSVNCAALDYRSWQCCPVSCSSLRSRVESPRVTGLPRLGHSCSKAAIQARPLGLEAARDMTLICALWDWKHHSPAQGLFFCLLLCIYICLPCDCKKSVSASNILIWITLQWGTFALRQITSYFRWIFFLEVGVCLKKAFMCLTSNLVG